MNIKKQLKQVAKQDRESLLAGQDEAFLDELKSRVRKKPKTKRKWAAVFSPALAAILALCVIVPVSVNGGSSSDAADGEWPLWGAEWQGSASSGTQAYSSVMSIGPDYTQKVLNAGMDSFSEQNGLDIATLQNVSSEYSKAYYDEDGEELLFLMQNAQDVCGGEARAALTLCVEINDMDDRIEAAFDDASQKTKIGKTTVHYCEKTWEDDASLVYATFSYGEFDYYFAFAYSPDEELAGAKKAIDYYIGDELV